MWTVNLYINNELCSSLRTKWAHVAYEKFYSHHKEVKMAGRELRRVELINLDGKIMAFFAMEAREDKVIEEKTDETHS